MVYCMGKRFAAVILIAALLLAAQGCILPSDGRENPTGEGKLTKAIWISQFDMTGVYLSGGGQRPLDDYTRLCAALVQNCADMGFDTVIVQLRPNGDGIYPSELFPPSRYAVGEYGKEFSYDPFAVLLREARNLGLSVHGWINPFRLMTADELTKVDGEYLIKKWWTDEDYRGRYIFEHGGRLYLNPAYADVRELIADGASEILLKYGLDGIHIDDYFYPHGVSDSVDLEAYGQLSGGLSLAEWRRENVSATVKQIYGAVKNANPYALFGVSPGGNMDTVFNTDYADVYKWCGERGYIDYICPQIYFGLEHETYDFASVYARWEAAVSCPDVELWVGMTLGKAVNGELGKTDVYAGSGGREWIERKDIIKRCLELVRQNGRTSGVVLFCYQYLFDPESGDVRSEIRPELENFLPVWREME